MRFTSPAIWSGVTPSAGSYPGGQEERFGWRVLRLNGLLQQAIEQQPPRARARAIEAERKLFEVVVEMLEADRSLVCAEEPAFEEGGDAVHRRHDHAAGSGEADWLMTI